MPKHMRNITVAKNPYCMQHATDEDSITASSICQHRTGLKEHYTSASPLQYYSRNTLLRTCNGFLSLTSVPTNVQSREQEEETTYHFNETCHKQGILQTAELNRWIISQV